MIIALPHQVNQDVQLAILRAFVMTHLVSRGMIADVAIHRPPVEHGGDPRNWHAHVLLTDRPMTPTGFAATKDRTWNAKENVTLWRKAWADTHNSAMQALGLPHRIDHRSLEAQRQEALAHGNTIAALDLDRTPQIHVGRDVYVSRRRNRLAPMALRNRQILDNNRQRAFHHKDALDAAIAKADTAAYLESRDNAIQCAAWEALPASVDDLRRAYGRPPARTALGRLKDGAFEGDVTRRALALSRSQGHPWRDTGHRPDAPSVLDTLLPMVRTTGPGHPVFTVTAKDIAFAFYGLGFINQRELETSLEHIAEEEQRLFAARLAKSKQPLPTQPLKPKPLLLPTPEAHRLKCLQRAAIVPQQIYLTRLAQLKAFDDRHRINAHRRIERMGQARLARRRQMTSAADPG